VAVSSLVYDRLGNRVSRIIRFKMSCVVLSVWKLFIVNVGRTLVSWIDCFVHVIAHCCGVEILRKLI